MIAPLYGHDAAVAQFVASGLNYERDFGRCKALGVLKNDELVAGIVYHDWSPEYETIQLSGYSVGKPWTNRSIVKAVFDYPFEFCQMVIAQTDPRNTPVRAIFGKLGSTEHLIPRLMGRDSDGVVITLTKEAWEQTKIART